MDSADFESQLHTLEAMFASGQCKYYVTKKERKDIPPPLKPLPKLARPRDWEAPHEV